MLTSKLEEARLRYVQERPIYESVAKAMAAEVRHEAYRKRLDCLVSSRAKEVSSFVKKALTDKRVQNPYDDVYDKAGVRVVVAHGFDIDVTLQILRELFGEPSYLADDRHEDLPEDQLRYPRIHAQMVVPEVLALSLNAGAPMSCEFQIRTEASNLWSRMSHSLLYKPEISLPKSVRRSLYRLLALIELFDSEVQRAVAAMKSDPDRELNQLVAQLERIFLAFCGADFNAHLTRDVAGLILQTLRPEVQADYCDVLAEFAKRKRLDLEATYRDYGPNSEPGRLGSYLLASQPESIAIFERLESAPRAISALWKKTDIPEDLLDQMKDLWAA
ncbi:hypothetical protein ACN27G_03390 [Plantactinospora sp. WMMB334]|uniref:hypothetical protein n=1 Tax=Plantactinospora sp. WMMB334 TaxID=3404119 RepID=UPI003B95CAE1